MDFAPAHGTQLEARAVLLAFATGGTLGHSGPGSPSCPHVLPLPADWNVCRTCFVLRSLGTRRKTLLPGSCPADPRRRPSTALGLLRPVCFQVAGLEGSPCDAVAASASVIQVLLSGGFKRGRRGSATAGRKVGSVRTSMKPDGETNPGFPAEVPKSFAQVKRKEK